MQSLNGSHTGILDAVWDSVLLLCDSLLNAVHFLYRGFYRLFRTIAEEVSSLSNLLHHELHSRIISQLFRLNNWCPRESRVVSDIVEGNTSLLSLCAQVDRQEGEPSGAHVACDRTLCKQAYQIDDATYQPKHALDDCDCGMLRLAPAYQIKMAEDITNFQLHETYLRSS